MHKRRRPGLTEIGQWCHEHRDMPVDEQRKTLNAKLRARYRYYR